MLDVATENVRATRFYRVLRMEWSGRITAETRAAPRRWIPPLHRRRPELEPIGLPHVTQDVTSFDSVQVSATARGVQPRRFLGSDSVASVAISVRVGLSPVYVDDAVGSCRN